MISEIKRLWKLFMNQLMYRQHRIELSLELKGGHDLGEVHDHWRNQEFPPEGAEMLRALGGYNSHSSPDHDW